MSSFLPLAGVRVADFTRVLTGPFCTMLLADLGAEVIKIEPPGGDDTRAWGPPFQRLGKERESSYFLSVNRGKRSVVLDLKTPEGLRAARAIVGQADVLVENFRPGTLEKLGLGWDALHAEFPRLIYGAISGFGQAGPYRDRAGYDVIAQGMGGVMSYNGEEGRAPVRVGVAVADVFAGSLITQGLLAALYQREKTGLGARVDVNLLEAVIALGSSQVSRYLAAGEIPRPMGNDHRSIVPYGTYLCGDGFVNVAVGNDSLWRRFCAALELQGLAADPALASNEGRVAGREALNAALLAGMARSTRAEVMARLDAAGVPCGPVYDMQGVFEDEHVRDQHIAVSVPHASLGQTTVTAAPWSFDGLRPPVRRGPPVLGEHTAEVLAELELAELQLAEPSLKQ